MKLQFGKKVVQQSLSDNYTGDATVHFSRGTSEKISLAEDPVKKLAPPFVPILIFLSMFLTGYILKTH